MSEGDKSLSKIARELGISLSFIFSWLAEDGEFAEKYARAREIGTDAAFERITDMAAELPASNIKGYDAAYVQWQKNRIDTEKWVLSKRSPKKYGDKMQHTGEDGGPINFVVTRAGSKEK